MQAYQILPLKNGKNLQNWHKNWQQKNSSACRYDILPKKLNKRAGRCANFTEKLYKCAGMAFSQKN